MYNVNASKKPPVTILSEGESKREKEIAIIKETIKDNSRWIKQKLLLFSSNQMILPGK